MNIFQGQNTVYSLNVFSGQGEWREESAFEFGRVDHACGLIEGDDGTEIVVAAGDCTGYETCPGALGPDEPCFCPTEIFNIGNGEWRTGKSSGACKLASTTRLKGLQIGASNILQNTYVLLTFVASSTPYQATGPASVPYRNSFLLLGGYTWCWNCDLANRRIYYFNPQSFEWDILDERLEPNESIGPPDSTAFMVESSIFPPCEDENDDV